MRIFNLRGEKGGSVFPLAISQPYQRLRSAAGSFSEPTAAQAAVASVMRHEILFSPIIWSHKQVRPIITLEGWMAGADHAVKFVVWFLRQVLDTILFNK